MPKRRLSRRRLLGAALALPLTAVAAACGGDRKVVDLVSGVTAPEPTPSPTPEPPFILAAGEERRLLMAGTPHETPLYVFATGLLGPIVMTLGGVHGNEPGGWLAAERVLERLRPTTGAFIVVPRANKLAVAEFVRTTPELGDLNRLYPGDPNGLPMARMAAEILAAMRELHVSHVVDMHESWAFYKDRPQNSTAFLGQTIASFAAEPGLSLGRTIAEAENQRVRAPQEELFFRGSPGSGGQPPDGGFVNPPDTARPGGGGSGSSSLSLPRHLPGLVALLVEMGQQQALERRIALHVDVLQELMRQTGALA
jgi:hypothetical protein